MKTIDVESDLVLGVDVGATATKAGVVSRGKRNLLGFFNIPTLDIRDPKSYTVELISCISALKIGKNIQGIGFGIPSWNGEVGEVENSPNMPFLNGYPLIVAIEEAFPELRGKIKVDNDANIAGDAEIEFGDWDGIENGVNILTLGGGVGWGGYTYDTLTGKLIKITGKRSRGGEGGHIPIPHPPGAPIRKCGCGYEHCLEAYASVTAVNAFARLSIARNEKGGIAEAVRSDPNFDRERKLIDQVNPKHVEQAAIFGDDGATQIENWLVYALAHGIRAFNQLFDPGLFVICGGMSRWATVIRKTRLTLHRLPGVVPNKKVRVYASKLDAKTPHSGILGAAALVFRSLE